MEETGYESRRTSKTELLVVFFFVCLFVFFFVFVFLFTPLKFAGFHNQSPPLTMFERRCVQVQQLFYLCLNAIEITVRGWNKTDKRKNKTKKSTQTKQIEGKKAVR